MSGQVLGLFGDIVNKIGGIFSGIANWINDMIGMQLDAFMVTFMKLVYEVLKVFFLLLDFIQLVFRKMVGLDAVYFDGQRVEGDLALYFFRNEFVLDALIALTVTAFVLVFMATFVAIIQSHYSPNVKEYKTASNATAVGPVIGMALKAIFSFVLVPVVCYFGVFVSNGILGTIDRATRVSGALSISGEVFVASAVSANRARIDSNFNMILHSGSGEETLSYNGYFVDDSNPQYAASKTAADKIDVAFATKMKAVSESGGEYYVDASYDDGLKFMYRQDSPGHISHFDYMNTDLVHVYYDFHKFNWLFAFVSCFFVMATLLVAAMGVIQRLFEITILFAISPPFIALMPLDGGSAFRKWRGEFVKNVLIGYGTIVGLNFFFIIAPILQSIDLFGSPDEIATYGKMTCDLFNAIAHVLFIMCGSLMIKDMGELVNNLVGGNSLANMGGKVRGEANKNITQGSKMLGSAKNALHTGAGMALSAGKAAYKKASDLKKRATSRENKLYKADKKAIKAMVKSGEISRGDARRAKRMAKDDYRESIGKSKTFTTRAKDRFNNAATKWDGKQRGLSDEGKTTYQNVKTMGAMIKADKENYKAHVKSDPWKKRLSYTHRKGLAKYKDPSLKAYRASPIQDYRDDYTMDAADWALHHQVVLGTMTQKEFTKQMRKKHKDEIRENARKLKTKKK